MSLFAGMLSRGRLFGQWRFAAPWSPAALFVNSEQGAWLDLNDLSLLYTTSVGATNVAAINDPIGRVERKYGTVHALNATSTQRPLLKQLPSGRYNAYHDRVDDKLTLASMPAGTYTIGAATFAGVQIYPHVHNTTGTLDIPGADYTEIVIVNRSLTEGETAALRAYLDTKAPTIGATDVFRLYCSSSSVNLEVTETGGSAGITWELGDGQTASGTSCVKTITPPQSVILRATDKSKIKYVYWHLKNLFGQFPEDLRELTSLQVLYAYTNGLVSPFPILPASVTGVMLAYNNIYGKIPDLSHNTNLVSYGARYSKVSGWTGGTVSATLGTFESQGALLTAEAVNAILAAFVAAGRTSASGTCVLNLDGTGNAAPTGQGITDKTTLQSRGWTVTTN